MIGCLNTPLRSTVASIKTSPPPAMLGAGNEDNSALRRRGGVNFIDCADAAATTLKASVAATAQVRIIEDLQVVRPYRPQASMQAGRWPGTTRPRLC